MATAKKQHFFVLNQLGQSAARRGPFESAEAAREWASKNFSQYPGWLVAVEPLSKLCKSLDKEGQPTEG